MIHAAAQGQYNKARIALGKALRTYPGDATTHDNMADVFKLLDLPATVKGQHAVAKFRQDYKADTMVVTFGEVASGERSGPTKRQYWLRQGGTWKIFFEGIIG